MNQKYERSMLNCMESVFFIMKKMLKAQVYLIFMICFTVNGKYAPYLQKKKKHDRCVSHVSHY